MGKSWGDGTKKVEKDRDCGCRPRSSPPFGVEKPGLLSAERKFPDEKKRLRRYFFDKFKNEKE
ncbi:MAG: hypothetical protein Q4D60_05795 [Eubacteriales bacterium]|nr:hypothetical protein [Eubacteriales bacterium]